MKRRVMPSTPVPEPRSKQRLERLVWSVSASKWNVNVGAAAIDSELNSSNLQLTVCGEFQEPQAWTKRLEGALQSREIELGRAYDA